MKARMVSMVGLCLSFFIEWLAIQYVDISWSITFIWHGVACLVEVIMVYLVLRERFTHSDIYFYVFLYGLSFIVPVFGMALSLLIAYWLYYRHASIYKYSEWVDTTINLNLLKMIMPKYGAGGAMMSLFNRKASPLERTQALFSLSKRSLASMNPYIEKLLPGESDEMRLLAFNILDEEEGRINQKIAKLEAVYQASLQTAHGEDEQCKIAEQLASLYWELIFNHLILPELQQNILEKALFYAKKAFKTLSQDPFLWGLLGKIYRQLKEYDKAENAFRKALALNLPASQALPYLAEMQYMQAKYVDIEQYLNASDTLDDIDLIYLVKQFWCGERK